MSDEQKKMDELEKRDHDAYVAMGEVDIGEHNVNYEPPWDWPEMFTEPSLRCIHQFQWDDDDCVYRCMNGCEEVRKEP